MLDFMKNSSKPKEVGSCKGEELVVFSVTTNVKYNDRGDLTRKIRVLRKTLKNTINENESMKVAKIDNKTGE